MSFERCGGLAVAPFALVPGVTITAAVPAQSKPAACHARLEAGTTRVIDDSGTAFPDEGSAGIRTVIEMRKTRKKGESR